LFRRHAAIEGSVARGTSIPASRHGVSVLARRAKGLVVRLRWIGPVLGRPPGPPDQPGPRYPSGPPRWPHEGWQELQKNDPELWKLLRADLDLEERTRQLALQYRQAPEEQREAIRKEMEKLVGEHFDVRQQRRVLELNRLQEELKRLQQSIDDRNKAREQIVNKRVQELLGIDEGLRF
jgi:hypothetical protein